VTGGLSGTGGVPVTGGVVTAGGVVLSDGEYELKLVAASPDQSAALPGGDGVVVLDLEVTPDLAAEGLARDVVRAVQQARREAGLEVTDRISLMIEASAEVAAAVRAHRDLIARETLATVVSAGQAGDGGAREADAAVPADAGHAAEAGHAGEAGFVAAVGDGETVRIWVTRARTSSGS